MYATIKEVSSTRITKTVCKSAVRERHVYMSHTSAVEIRVVGTSPSTHDFFLLRYEGLTASRHVMITTTTTATTTTTTTTTPSILLLRRALSSRLFQGEYETVRGGPSSCRRPRVEARGAERGRGLGGGVPLPMNGGPGVSPPGKF